MACSSCATKDGQPKGCKNNGTCGTDGCNKLTVFDWLSNMSLPAGEKIFPYVEVRFKNGRKEYLNNNDLNLTIGDIVATQVQSGHDVGIVSLAGELVRVQMKRKKISLDGEKLPKVYRIASQKDIDKWQGVRDREEPIKVRARQIAIDLKLEMKISDIEFQGDGSKATFFYTADDRVDFRQLIKEYAKEFAVRIEMRQIGLRQEASRLGGIGSCGRELCCSTWLTDFRSVNTSAARYQQLSLNPQKLAGQCGKLKCCLNFELDAYVEALNEFPKTDTKIKTEKGIAACQKIDIFKGALWYAYEGEWMNWYKVSAEDANEMIRMNKADEPVAALEDYVEEEIPVAEKLDFENVVGQDSLTRFDQPKRSKNRRNRKGRAGNHKSPNRSTENSASAKTTTEKREPANKKGPKKFVKKKSAPNNNPKTENTGSTPQANKGTAPKKRFNKGRRKPKPNNSNES